MTRTHPEPSDVAVDELKRKARRRLIGAIVLALAAAVALPLLFESEPRPLGEDVSVQIPPIDGGKFVTPLASQVPAKSTPDPSGRSNAVGATSPDAKDRMPSAGAERTAQQGSGSPAGTSSSGAVTTAPLASGGVIGTPLASSDGARSDGASADVPKADASAPGTPPPFVTAPAPDRSASSKSETKSDARSDAKPVAKVAGGFVVQVAALADPKGASRLVTRLKNAGFPGYSESFPANGRTMQRVRVGPYHSREAADTARSKLKAAGFSGMVDSK